MKLPERALVALTMIMAFPTLVQAQVPNTFQAGQPARAAEVNENFADLDGRVTANSTGLDSAITLLTLDRFSIRQDSVAALLCPEGTEIISAGCYCDNENGTRNSGHLFACTVAGNGGIGSCSMATAIFDPTLGLPMAEVVIICASAQTGATANSEPDLQKLQGPGFASKNTTSVDFDRQLVQIVDQIYREIELLSERFPPR